MAICDACKKHPLEMREINNVTDGKGSDKVLCDECHNKIIRDFQRTWG